jgi:hypothetical protein
MGSFCFTLKTEFLVFRYPQTVWPRIEGICVCFLDTKELMVPRAVTMDEFLDLAEKYANVIAFNLDRFVWPCLQDYATVPQKIRLTRLRDKFRCAMKECKAFLYYNGDRKYVSLEDAFKAFAGPGQAERVDGLFRGYDPSVLKCQKLSVVAERILRA